MDIQLILQCKSRAHLGCYEALKGRTNSSTQKLNCFMSNNLEHLVLLRGAKKDNEEERKIQENLPRGMPNSIPILEVPPRQPLIHVEDLGENKIRVS